MKKNNKNRGISILGILILGVIVILVLGYFQVSVKGVVESPGAQDNLHYVGGVSRNLWDRYLKEPAVFLWNDVWMDIFWKPFISNMERIRDGKPSDFEKSMPTINY